MERREREKVAKAKKTIRWSMKGERRSGKQDTLEDSPWKIKFT